MSSILVLGAGELGLPVLTSLSQLLPSTSKITVLLRPASISSPSPSKQAEISQIRSQNIVILPGDIVSLSRSELSDLVKPYDTVISCLGFASGKTTQLKIAEAVLDAKVERYFPWQFGVDYDIIGRGSAQDLFDVQCDVRSLLRGQNRAEQTEWVIVSTGMFTSFLFESSFGVVEFDSEENDVTVRALGGWENKVTVTTPEDIGHLVAEIVKFEPRIANQVVYTAGETISYSRLADLVEELTGRNVKRELWSVEQLKEELRADPENHLRKYRVVFAEGKGVSWDVEKSFNKQNGIETDNVKAWAIKNLPQCK
ncbi:putative isoflavone oxidoreductase [Xylogone sp. PMI_703]|nr:putative isoflavone oxidoreductase [Xylogone sp. PMI_703]